MVADEVEGIVVRSFMARGYLRDQTEKAAEVMRGKIEELLEHAE